MVIFDNQLKLGRWHGEKEKKCCSSVEIVKKKF